MNKKAQGLSLEFIVIAAVAALVLIVAIAFFVSGSSTFLPQILGAGPSELDSARSACNTACQQSQDVTSDEAWDASAFCKKTFRIDLNKDSQYDEDESAVNCFDDAVDVSCTASATTATQQISCDEEACGIKKCTTTILK